jgi:glyoxylase-like metal-dependent hydrolase (beta-lactamase superfamily II)
MSVKIPFRRELAFEYGQVDQISPRIRRVVARNPSPFTLYGTGTYIVGRGQVAVVDPGPDDDAHIQAILAATANETITHILVTHTHRDHSPGCRPLQAACGAAKTYAYGPHGSGQKEDKVKIEEGADLEFKPDVEVRHGDILQGDGWSIECVYTPGHTSNHMCFALREEKVLFTGDHVMGWSTSVISPPDGDMRAYMASLELLLERDDATYWPTHGPAVEDPKTHVSAFIEHRREREQQILECIGRGVSRIRDMVPLMYKDLPEFMYPAAARSVLAAAVYMAQRGEISTEDGTLDMNASYRRVEQR